MSVGRSILAALGLLLSTTVGFVGAAGGFAYYQRNEAAKPWQDVTVEHHGQAGEPTQTTIRFKNQKLLFSSLELLRNEKGQALTASAVLRKGEELALRFANRRPSELFAKDGSHAKLDYKGRYVWVTVTGSKDQSLGQHAVKVPVELRQALRIAQRPATSETARWVATRHVAKRAASLASAAWQEASDVVAPLTLTLIGEAHAQTRKQDSAMVLVERDVVVHLSVQGARTEATSLLSASCHPFACSPRQTKLTTPASTQVRIAISTQVARKKLKGADGTKGLERFMKQAGRERSEANRVMADAGSLVAAIGVTARACRQLKLTVGVCVADLDRASQAAASYGLMKYRLKTKGRVLQERAMTLRDESLARRLIDKVVPLEVCVSRRGFARSCGKQNVRPFASKAQAPIRQNIVLQRGLAGTVTGTFELVQKDGPDCKFSPSPKTGGQLSLRFDQKTGTMTAKLSASERGKRSSLSCSLGIGDMHWTQSYTAQLSQRFSEQQLRTAGNRLPLRLKGTMRGSGNFRWQNCKSKSGANAACPGGKTAPYTYRMELIGYLDTATQRGSGRLRVSGSPLTTSGRWGVPKK